MLAASQRDLVEANDHPLSSLASVVDIDSDGAEMMIDDEDRPAGDAMVDVDGRKSSLTAAEVAAWLKSSGLKNDYQASSSGAIKFKGRLGLRSHPATILLLTAYFQELYTKLPQVGEDRIILLSENHNSLVAMLVQESTVAHPADEIQDMLLPYCEPSLAGIQPRFQLDGAVLTLSQLVSAIASPRPYGLLQLAKAKGSCSVWEVHETFIERFIPVTVRRLVVARRVAREMLCSQLNSEYRRMLGIDEDVSVLAAESDNTSKAASPAKPKAKPPKGPPAEKKKPDQKLSSFFTVIKKQPAADQQATEYFQPFHLREDCVLAPTSYFADYMMMAEEDTQMDPSDFWRVFARHAKKSPLAYQGKPQASCLAWPGGSRYFTVKLIQFHENYRPAYYGTMTRSPRTRAVTGRNPLGREPGVDYEVDSDDDWAEEMEVAEDAEDILSEDDEEDEPEDEDEEDEEEMEAEADGEGSWLVPEGPVDDMPVFKRQSYKKGEKKRYVQLQPTVYYSADGLVPDMLRTVKARILTGSWSVDPFEGAPIPEPPKPTEPAVPKIPFPEAALPELARLAHGTVLGVAKLYDQFSAKHGKVSKKQFELRLNQIAEKKLLPTTGRPAWQVRPEYVHYLSTEPDPESIGMAVQEVAMLD